jgi:hypothetical protein
VTANRAPDVVIAAPLNGAWFAVGESPVLTGHATDAEEGALVGSMLTWSSSVAGVLGQGTTVVSSPLVLGMQDLFLQAADSHGAVGTDRIVIRGLPDEDQDRIPDDWEAAYGRPTDSDANAHTDTDGDGHTDYQEWLCGTDPTNAVSVLRVTGLVPTLDGGLAITWTSSTTRQYTVRGSTDLRAGFTALEPGLRPTAPEHTLFLPSTLQPAAAYDVRAER